MIKIGKLRYSDNSVYEGEIVDRAANGKGVLRTANGAIYQGYFQDNLMEGQGKMTYPDGGVYKGSFYENKKEGYGEYYYPDGAYFKGEWTRGKKSHGKLVDTKGRAYKVYYEGGYLVEKTFIGRTGRRASPGRSRTPKKVREEVTIKRAEKSELQQKSFFPKSMFEPSALVEEKKDVGVGETVKEEVVVVKKSQAKALGPRPQNSGVPHHRKSRSPAETSRYSSKEKLLN